MFEHREGHAICEKTFHSQGAYTQYIMLYYVLHTRQILRIIDGHVPTRLDMSFARL